MQRTARRLATAFLLFCPSALWAQAAGAEVRDALEQMRLAVERKDWAVVEQYLSPGFRRVTADGRLSNRAEFLAWLRQRADNFNENSDDKIVMHGDAAVVHRLVSRGRGKNRQMELWTRRPAGWTLAWRQTTPVEEQASTPSKGPGSASAAPGVQPKKPPRDASSR